MLCLIALMIRYCEIYITITESRYLVTFMRFLSPIVVLSLSHVT